MSKEFVPMRDYTKTNFQKGFKPADNFDRLALGFYTEGRIIGIVRRGGRRKNINDAHLVNPHGRIIRELRTQNGISMNRFAQEIGIAKATMHHIETGKTRAGEDIIERIAKRLGVEPGRLIL